MVDSLAAEYGWNIEYILNLSEDVTTQLYHAILHRKGVTVWRNRMQTENRSESLSDRCRSIFGQIDKN